MKEIILDESLEVNENADFGEFNQRNFFDIETGFEAVTSFEAEVVHRNYLDYLTLCWGNHYGIVVSPTILWNMVLNNLAYRVNQEPETFRKYFTEFDEKQEICVMQGGNQIDVKLLIAGLQGRIPSNMLDISFPEFSTNTENSKIADYTAFLDMVSPYYNFSMFLCGIPKVRVLGTNNDWLDFVLNLDAITAILPECQDYLLGVANHIANVVEETADFSDFFRLDKCGSGSQVEVGGWIKDFFIEQPRIGYPENYISCISKINYHNYNDNKDYRLYAGLFTSKISEGYLIPAFDKIYYLKS